MAGENTNFYSDGKSVDVDLLYTVPKGQVAVVDGWLGIAGSSGDSGDSIALLVDDREYVFSVPADLAAEKGDIIYITVADLTGHIPDDTAYGKTAGAGAVAFFKATMDQNDDDKISGILLAHNALAS